MKKNIILIFCSVLCLTSCKDFLKQSNPNKIESEYFFTDESSLVIYTNGLIRDFATEIDSFMGGDKYSDTHSFFGTYLYYTDNYTADDASNWSNGNWSALRSVNYYLTYMRDANAKAEVLDHYEGVGRFFRAMFYISKVQTFGAVPWYDHVVDSGNQEDLYKPRDNRQLVCRHILEDLNYACEHCSSSSTYRAYSSYVHKYVALALKARFCLYEGTYQKYHTVDPSTGKPWVYSQEDTLTSEAYLRECVKACKEIMNSKVYGLIDNASNRSTQYRNMFNTSGGGNTCGKEFIWARGYDVDLKVTYAINRDLTNVQYGRYAFNRDFVMTYLMTDGTPFTDKHSAPFDVDFSTECKDRDLRMAQTMRTPGFTRSNGKSFYAPDITYSLTGYQPVKYLTDEVNDGIAAAIATDVPLMRYAEVLLNYAEAKAELGELDINAWNESIKLLRERAGVKSLYPSKADPYLVSYFLNIVTDPLILEVRRERGVELAMENLRYQDVMRWHVGDLLTAQKRGLWISGLDTPIDLNGDGKAETWVSKSVTEKTGYNVLPLGGDYGHKLSLDDHGYILPYTALVAKQAWHDYKYLRPIPKSAILVNPNLAQNPGWEE